MSKTDAELAAKTDEALRQMAARVRAETIEECAELAESWPAYALAFAIRTLAKKPPQG